MAQQRFGPHRNALAPVLVCFLGALPVALGSPWLTWILLLPLAAACWVWRARVIADEDGLVVGNGLGLRRHGWQDVDGVDIPRYGPVRLVLSSGRRVPLTALPRRDVRRLLAAAPRRQRGEGGT